MLYIPPYNQTAALSLHQVTGELDIPLIAQLVRGLANVIGVGHVALELAGHVDLTLHTSSETDVDVDVPILLDDGRIDGSGSVYRATLLEQIDQRLGILRLYLEHLAPRYARIARYQVDVLVLIRCPAQAQPISINRRVVIRVEFYC